MRGRIVFAVWLSLAAVGCTGSAPPTQPTPVALGPGDAQTAANGNSEAVQRCLDGWQNLRRSDGTGFSSFSECVKYAAQGGSFGSRQTIYTLTATGTGVGDFGWSFATAGFITATTSFNSFLSTSSPAGCTISSVTINNPSNVSPYVETFFNPRCGALLVGEEAQTFWNAGPFNHTGDYAPQAVVEPPVWRLTITQQ